jgi:hypothetical protein
VSHRGRSVTAHTPLSWALLVSSLPFGLVLRAAIEPCDSTGFGAIPPRSRLVPV